MMRSVKKAEEDKRREMESQKTESLKENRQLLRLADESTINATSITEEDDIPETDAQEKKKKIWSINYPQQTMGLSWAILYET